MKASEQTPFPPLPNDYQGREKYLQTQLDGMTDEIPSNPLKTFFDKDQCMQIKTMESLNQNYTKLNTQKKNKQAQNSKVSIDSGPTHGRVFQSFSFQSKGSQNSNSMKKYDLSDHIIEDRRNGENTFQNKKKNFSSLKIHMDQLINIKQNNVLELYEMEELVGQGSFGTVYRARCKKTHQTKAIKVVKDTIMGQKKMKQFLAETALLKRINHPCIIKVDGLYRYEGNFYLVMEYCQGGDLKDLLKIKPTSEKYFACIIKQILGALAYLHSLNIVHRDIKPENFVFLNKITERINEYQPIKMIDFGTAIKMKYKFQHQEQIQGTCAYMAPQVFKGVLTEKSDIWSTAILMLKLMTSINPYLGMTVRDTRFNIETKEINLDDKPYNNLSKQARDLLKKMLQRNVHKRPSARQLLKHPWFGQCSSSFANADVIKDLKKYSLKDNFVQVIECYLTLHKVNQEERQKLGKLFMSMDRSNSGHIEKTQLIELFKLYSNSITNQELENMITLIDKDKSGKIDFNQFMVAMSNKEKLFIRSSLCQAFDHFDKNGTGFIEKDELEEMLKDGPSQQIQYFLSYLDKDQDNRISKDEFIQYLQFINNS